MLRYQILVCNEEFVFHVHAAAIKLGSCAECAANPPSHDDFHGLCERHG